MDETLPIFNGVTLDMKTTQDCDDAFWVETHPDGYFLTISIADVSHYVRPHSDADVLAYQRLETEYKASGHLPMFDDLERQMSLLPDKPRRVVALQVLLGPNGGIIKTQFRRGFLTSSAKLAYQDVPKMLSEPGHVQNQQMRLAQTVALKLMQQRKSLGALAFYDLRQGWVTSETGQIKYLKEAQRNVGYIIVQEFAILYNRCVAQWAATEAVPILYRNHKVKDVAPDRESLTTDYFITMGDQARARSFQIRLRACLGRAYYGRHLDGHWALSLPFYCHATSSIRRYADLITQRQLAAFIAGDDLPYTGIEIESFGRSITERINARRQQRMEESKESDQRMNADRAKGDLKFCHAQFLIKMPSKEFSEVLKYALEVDEYVTKIADAVIGRLRSDTVPAVCLLRIVACEHTSWTSLRHQVMGWVENHDHYAPTLLSLGHAILGWSTARYGSKTYTGPDHLRKWGITGSIYFDPAGPPLEAIVPPIAPNSKRAVRRAAFCLLCAHTGFRASPYPYKMKSVRTEEVTDAPPSAPMLRPKIHMDMKVQNVVGALQTYAQKLQKPFPEYVFESKQGLHHLEYKCTCSFEGITEEGPWTPGKRRTKHLAAVAVRKEVHRRTSTP